MSKASAVKMAEILFGAGYDPHKSLDLVGYPKMTAFRITPAPTDTEAKVVLFHDDGSLGFPKTEETIFFNAGALPIESYFEFFGKKTLQFSYTDNGTMKQFATDRLSIPSAPQWPAPSFLTLLYPPE